MDISNMRISSAREKPEAERAACYCGGQMLYFYRGQTIMLLARTWYYHDERVVTCKVEVTLPDKRRGVGRGLSKLINGRWAYDRACLRALRDMLQDNSPWDSGASLEDGLAELRLLICQECGVKHLLTANSLVKALLPY